MTIHFSQSACVISFSKKLTIVLMVFLLLFGGQTKTVSAQTGQIENAPINVEVPQDHHQVVESGMMLINNQIVDAPFFIHIMHDAIHVNGIRIGDDLRNYFPHQTTNAPMLRKIGLLKSANELIQCLEENGLLVVLDGEHFVALHHFDADVLCHELKTRPSMSSLAGPEMIPPPIIDLTRPQIEKIIRFFRPTEELMERLMQQQIEDCGDRPVQQKSGSAVSMPVVYLATIVGMILVVVVFGGLLMHHPQKHKNWREIDTSDSTRSMFVRCIVWIVVLSLFDLGFTILAQQSGSFTESNPIAARFVHSPLMLSLFKCVLMSIGLGILFMLRSYHGAQLACWWLCLICTTLAFRWVVFSSMFMA